MRITNKQQNNVSHPFKSYSLVFKKREKTHCDVRIKSINVKRDTKKQDKKASQRC